MSIQKNNSIVEEALLQMKAVEEAINENAKGILASTMKEEISELVRESLRDSKKSKRSLVEQEEDGEEVIATTDDTEIGGTEQEDDTEDFDETEFDMNLSGGMEPEISMPDDNEDERPPLNMTQAPIADVMRVFQAMGDEDGIMIQKDETGNIHLTDNNKNSEYIIQMGGGMDNMDMTMNTETNEGVLYELSFNEETEDETKDDSEETEENEGVVYELEMGEAFKPKGRVGKMKFKYPSKIRKGVTETEDAEEEKDWMEMDDMEDEELKGETKEGSRTMTYKRRAERDRVSAPSQLRKESTQKEMNLLQEKNEEYKKALDFFRNKLNEVAVFNSNLAYSTRLFTEHTTTKQEKINILRRFDSVESLKESKSLYKTIKSELDDVSSNKGIFTESVERKVTKTPQNGSATNLIESKTYENPQFMRMKDLMTKIK
jgi:hypothetical protein